MTAMMIAMTVLAVPAQAKHPKSLTSSIPMSLRLLLLPKQKMKLPQAKISKLFCKDQAAYPFMGYAAVFLLIQVLLIEKPYKTF